MTREQTKRLLADGVLQAWADGKQIQRFTEAEGWHDIPSADLGDLSKPYSFRVKPPPRERWIVGDVACKTEGEAKHFARIDALNALEIIHVIEKL